MFSSAMTLRSIWESIQQHARVGWEALETKDFVDWPIWLVLLSVPLVLVALRLLLPVTLEAVGLVVWIAQGLRREVPATLIDLARLSKRGRSRYPDPNLDPADRKMWVSRKGRFSDDPAERERWYNREGEYSEDRR